MPLNILNLFTFPWNSSTLAWIWIFLLRSWYHCPICLWTLWSNDKEWKLRSWEDFFLLIRYACFINSIFSSLLFSMFKSLLLCFAMLAWLLFPTKSKCQCHSILSPSIHSIWSWKKISLPTWSFILKLKCSLFGSLSIGTLTSRPRWSEKAKGIYSHFNIWTLPQLYCLSILVAPDVWPDL